MGNLIISAVVAAAVLGGYSYMKSQNSNVASEIKTAKAVKTYVNKSKLLNNSNYNQANLFITNQKELMYKLQKAMDTALKTKQNPTCNDLANTGKITLSECETAMKMKTPAVILNQGSVELANTNDKTLKNVIAYRLASSNTEAKDYVNKLDKTNNVQLVYTQIENNIKYKTNSLKEYADLTKNYGDTYTPVSFSAHTVTNTADTVTGANGITNEMITLKNNITQNFSEFRGLEK